jgi:hypothetical protein
MEIEMIQISNLLITSFTSGLMYLGPESIMPIASVLAAIIGVILILWRYLIGIIKRAYKYLYHKITRTPVPEPIIIDLDDEEDDPISQDVVTRQDV